MSLLGQDSALLLFLPPCSFTPFTMWRRQEGLEHSDCTIISCPLFFFPICVDAPTRGELCGIVWWYEKDVDMWRVLKASWCKAPDMGQASWLWFVNYLDIFRVTADKETKDQWPVCVSMCVGIHFVFHNVGIHFVIRFTFICLLVNYQLICLLENTLIPGKRFQIENHFESYLCFLSEKKNAPPSSWQQWGSHRGVSFWLRLNPTRLLSAVQSTCLPRLSDGQMFGLWGEEVTPPGALCPVIGCHTQLPKVGKSDFLASVGVRPGIMWKGEGFNCSGKCVRLSSHWHCLSLSRLSLSLPVCFQVHPSFLPQVSGRPLCAAVVTWRLFCLHTFHAGKQWRCRLAGEHVLHISSGQEAEYYCKYTSPDFRYTKQTAQTLINEINWSQMNMSIYLPSLMMIIRSMCFLFCLFLLLQLYSSGSVKDIIVCLRLACMNIESVPGCH